MLRALACSSFSTSLERSRSSDFWWTWWVGAYLLLVTGERRRQLIQPELAVAVAIAIELAVKLFQLPIAQAVEAQVV